jgi:HAE1 family hydrophobic/amphiphilic exporter-1
MRRAPEKRMWFFRAFNAAFDFSTGIYSAVVRAMLRRVVIVLLLFAGLAGLTGWGFSRLPTGFLPVEDQGCCFIDLQLPDASSLERTERVLDRLDRILGKTPGVIDWLSIGGFSLLNTVTASNSAMVVAIFKPWDDRTSPAETQDAIVAHLRRELAKVTDANAIVFVPPAIDGLGNASGFQMQVQDRGGIGLDELGKLVEEMVRDGNAQSGLAALATTFRPSTPQLFVDVDRTKVKQLDVQLSDVFATLQAFLGSAYVNDFNRFGRTYQVRVQAESYFRTEPDDIALLQVRNRHGQMLPLGTFVSVEPSFGPQSIQRHNMYATASITGQAAPGFSSGQALLIMEQMAAEKFPPAVGFEWTGMSYQERKVGKEQYVIFALAVVLVFLVLSAQYESWTMPMAVIAVVPLAALGVVAALNLTGADNNVYTQIGVVLLVALASKNAILIVEFAAEQRRGGASLLEAAAEAARLRFRAILMTAFSSILGFMPLLLASGAGAASRVAVGTAVVGGMIAATFFSLLFVPSFYLTFSWLGELFGRRKGGQTSE